MGLILTGFIDINDVHGQPLKTGFSFQDPSEMHFPPSTQKYQFLTSYHMCLACFSAHARGCNCSPFPSASPKATTPAHKKLHQSSFIDSVERGSFKNRKKSGCWQSHGEIH